MITTCRTCAQPDKRKEPCTVRNLIYESECSQCNQPGEKKENDKKGLEERRGIASLYVGESARSVHLVLLTTGEMLSLAKRRPTWLNTRLKPTEERTPLNSGSE